MNIRDYLTVRTKVRISGFLVAIFILMPLGTNLRPQIAQANLPVIDATAIVQETVTAIQTTLTAAATSLGTSILSTLNIKEFALDAIAFALAKKVLQEIVRSTVSWINSGFKGSPMFIQNFGQFMTNIADETAGQFIYGSDLAFLCRPIDIRIALQFSYTQSKRMAPAQCTLSGAVKNVTGFLNGKFSQGGWAGMMSLSLNPTNTMLGSLLSAEVSLNSRVGAATSQKKISLDWGKGFLSKEVCTEAAGPPAPGGAAPAKNCKIVTPGDTIAQQLTFDLSSGKQTLISADEINEIISALFSQLAIQAFTGAQGLLGLSQSGSGYGGSDYGYGGSAGTYGSYEDASDVSDYCAGLSYLEQLDDPTCNSETTGGDDEHIFASSSFAGEYAFQGMQRQVSRAAQSAMNLAVADDLTFHENGAVHADLSDIKDEADEAIAASAARILRLTELEAEYSAATTSGAQIAILGKVTNEHLLESLRTTASNMGDRVEADRTLDAIAALRARITKYVPPPDPVPDPIGGGYIYVPSGDGGGP